MRLRNVLSPLLALALLLRAALAQDCAQVDARCLTPPANVEPGAPSCQSCGTFSACGVVSSGTTCGAFCNTTVATWAVHATGCGVRPTPLIRQAALKECNVQCANTTVALASENAYRDPGDPQVTKAAVYVVCSPTETFSSFVTFVTDRECGPPEAIGTAVRVAAHGTSDGKRAEGRTRRSARLSTAARGEWYDDDNPCMGPNFGPRIIASDFK